MVLGDGFPKPAAVGGLNLSIVPPWFGQTRMEGGALPIALSSGVETVRVKEALQTRNPEPRFDSVETEEALAYIRNAGLSRGAPMQSTLHPKLTDDPHDVIVVPPDMVRVAPDPARVAPDVARAAPAEEEISSLLRDAARRHSDAQVPKASDMPAAAAIPPVDTTFRPAAAGVLGPGRTQSIGWRAMRGFTAVLLAACTAGAGIAWELHGDAAKQLIAPWVPKFALASSLPADQPVLSAQAAAPAAEAAAAPAQPAPPAQSAAEAAAPAAAAAPAETAQLQSMARDVATLGQEVVQLKASIEQIKASQQQISREIAKASGNEVSETKASEPVARPRISASPPRPAAARVRRPMPSYPPPQVAAAPPMPQTAARYPATAPYYGRQPDYMPRQIEPQPQIAADPQADPEVATAPRPPMPVR